MRRHSPVVCEAAESLPDNHGALLRFRSDAVARVVNQTFKRVSVTKGVCDGTEVSDRATIPQTNQYSLKVTGKVMPRSIMNLDPAERFIAPDNFLSELARYCSVQYGYAMTRDRLLEVKAEGGWPIVSTIPMPALMDILEWPNKPEFSALPIWSITARIVIPEIDVYQTLYYTNPGDKRYRASITGDRLIVECVREVGTGHTSIDHWLRQTANDFGLPGDKSIVDATVKFQKYGKLAPIPERIRKAFILWATDEWNIYSVGRFATWRQLLLDDVVNDIQVVDRFITERDNYTRRINS